MTGKRSRPCRPRPSRRDVLAAAGGCALSFLLNQPSFAHDLGNRVIRMVAGGGFPPFMVTADDGRLTGVYPNALSAMGEDLGWSFPFGAAPWARAQDMVRTGQADGFVTVPTPERQAYALFARQPLIDGMDVVLVYAAASPRRAAIERAASAADLQEFALVDYIGNGWGDAIWRGWPTVERVRDLRTLLRMVATGRAEIAVQPRAVVAAVARQAGLHGLIVYRSADFIRPGTASAFHFGLRRDYPDAAAVMVAYEEAQRRFIARHGVDELMERWS